MPVNGPIDPAEAAAYLDLPWLRDVAEVRGMSQAARAAKLNRENLYRMLASNGNPQWSSLNALLHSLGVRLAVEVSTPAVR